MPYRISLLLLLLFQVQSVGGQRSDSVYFTTGFKLGEVREHSVVIHTRLCAAEFPVPVKHARKEAPFRSPLEFNDSIPVEEMDGAVKGAFGQVKILLSAGSERIEGEWEYVSAYEDCTIKAKIDGLSPNTLYKVKLQGRREEGAPVSEISGQFRTAPAKAEAVPVTFTSSSCQYFWDFDDPGRGFKIYDVMMMVGPDFHCHTGDYVYYD